MYPPIKIFLVSALVLVAQTVVSSTKSTADLDRLFPDKTACFLLYDQSHDKFVVEYNPNQCAVRLSPNSTFKIPLSIMSFDQHIITQQTKFAWDRKQRFLPQWNQDQDPHSWLQNSVLWVSQELAPKLGLITIKKYLEQFNYGNQDFSGHPGKNDGLTQAWLSSSLQLSAYEQLEFLKRVFDGSLGVSADAILHTKENILLEQALDGWKIYGKTGSGNTAQGLSVGWFVGCLEQNNQRYIFVANFVDNDPKNNQQFGGPVAKKIVLNFLQKWGRSCAFADLPIKDSKIR